jgi:hypothetical protein
MIDFLKRIGLSLLLGIIFIYFSELMFWATPIHPESPLSYGILLTWLFYSLGAYIFLFLVSFFNVRTIWALFITGALYGWFIEGIVVQTTFEALPLSISFTGLAWHDLITVLCGWYLIRKTLQDNQIWKLIAVSIGIGLFFGIWSITWWVEEEVAVITSLRDFALYVGVSSLITIASYFLYDLIPLTDFKLTLVEKIFVGIGLSVWYIFIVISLPLALILIPLIAISILALWWNKKKEQEEDLIHVLNEKVPFYRYFILLLIPAISIGFYALALSMNLLLHTNWLIYLITTPAGFLLFIISLLMIFIRKGEKVDLKIQKEKLSETDDSELITYSEEIR